MNLKVWLKKKTLSNKTFQNVQILIQDVKKINKKNSCFPHGDQKQLSTRSKMTYTILIISSFLCFCVLVASHDSDLTNTFSNINKQ